MMQQVVVVVVLVLLVLKPKLQLRLLVLLLGSLFLALVMCPLLILLRKLLIKKDGLFADDVCTMTPSALGYFGISQLILFDGPTPTIREPQRTPNLARGYTSHLMVDYRRHVAKIHC